MGGGRTMVARFYCCLVFDFGESQTDNSTDVGSLLEISGNRESKDILNLVKLHKRIMWTGEKIYSMHQMAKPSSCPSNDMATTFQECTDITFYV